MKKIKCSKLYSCPSCDQEIEVIPQSPDPIVTCPGCHKKVKVIFDFDFENGMVKDDTVLKIV